MKTIKLIQILQYKIIQIRQMFLPRYIIDKHDFYFSIIVYDIRPNIDYNVIKYNVYENCFCLFYIIYSQI